MARANHSHWVGGPPCDLPTKKACEDRFADWQAMQHVLLAYRVVVEGRQANFHKDKGQFAQLVQLIAGEREDIVNDDGNPSATPWVQRLRNAVAIIIAGDLPGYNLYRLDTQSGQ